MLKLHRPHELATQLPGTAILANLKPREKKTDLRGQNDFSK